MALKSPMPGCCSSKELNQLESSMVLRDTQITDAGLRILEEMQFLHAVVVKGTQVTDAGVDRLKRPLHDISITR